MLRILTKAAVAVAAVVMSVSAASAGCCACGCGYQPVYQSYYRAPLAAPLYAPGPAYRVDQGPSYAVPAVTADEPVPEYGYRGTYPYVTYPHRHRVDYRRHDMREFHRSRFFGPRVMRIDGRGPRHHHHQHH